MKLLQDKTHEPLFWIVHHSAHRNWTTADAGYSKYKTRKEAYGAVVKAYKNGVKLLISGPLTESEILMFEHLRDTIYERNGSFLDIPESNILKAFGMENVIIDM